MSILLLCLIAFLASLLTFFSGFGLGTLLTPVFMLFFPVELAIGLTGVVHFFNNLFNPNSALGFSNAEMTKKLLLSNFLSGLTLTKSLIFVSPKGKIR